MRQCLALSWSSMIMVLCCAIPGAHGKTGGGGVTPDEVPTPSPKVPTPSPTLSQEPTVFEIMTSPPISDENSCRTSDTGVFGDIDGEPLVVSFDYAVELAEGTSESEFTSLLLPDLEIAMNDAILPSIFPECATATTNRRRLSSNHRQLSGTIAGISTRPFDSIENEIECTGSNCHGLYGTLTIFIRTTRRRRRSLQEEESHTTAVRTALKDSMDAGAFNDVAESIISVTWVDDGLDETPVEKPPPETDDNESSTDRSAGNTQVIAWTVSMGGAALLVVLIAALARRRRRNNNDDDQSAIEGNTTINSAI